MTARISRRTVLKGLGTAMALPLLEAMQPLTAFGGAADPEAPLRLAFVYVPNGINMPLWAPEKTGKEFELPRILKPLDSLKQDITVFSGLTLDKARANGDGAGDHARAQAAFLTGSQPRKTSGADIRAGISIDQVAAQKIGNRTRFPSLEIGCEGGRQSGNCDSGYSCAYQSTLSWRTESSPMGKEINPRSLFDRLFGNENAKEMSKSRAKRDRYRQSILDLVAEDARDLQRKLGATDQRKLEEYLAGVREIEQRMAKIEKEDAQKVINPKMEKPSGIPKGFTEHSRLLADMLVLAFQGDLTRIATFVFANDGSNRTYPEVKVPNGHHYLSHHRGNKEKLEKISRINELHIQQFAYLLSKLKGIKEGEGNLLDNSMIIYGSGIGDGNRHNHNDLPILLAGKGGGTIQSGRHIRVPGETPLMNLHLAALDRMGIHLRTFGDSTGRVKDL